jgi:hypothetical protein
VDGDLRHDKYWTTCNLECVSAIMEYLQQREQQGEGLVKDNSPLIRAKDTFRMTAPRDVKDDSIRYAVRQVLKRSGVYVKDKKKQELMMSHAFRKNFKTVCESSPMKSP